MCALFMLYAAALCAQSSGTQSADSNGASAVAANNVAADRQGAAAAGTGSEGASASGAQSLKNSEKDLLINTGSAPDSVSGGAPSTLWLFIRMIFVLALVIVCIYVLVYFLKKGFTQRSPESPFLKRAVSLTLAPGKAVHVITMPGKAWLVGTGESSVNLIGEITDKELVDRLILEADKVPSEKPKDFAGILAAFTATAKQTENVLKKQRRRFEKGGGNE